MDGAPMVVLSDALWNRDFGADPSIAGRMVQIGQREVRVGGVAPAGFQAILAGGFEFFRKCVWERPGFEVSPPTNWLNSSRVTIFPRKA
jgi:hypothetical protein